MTNITEIIPDNMPEWMIKAMADGQLFNEVIKRVEQQEKECICKGNWQSIIKESEPLLDKIFLDRNGKAFRFIGVMHSEDDYYYCLLSMTGTLTRASCVMNLDTYGYILDEQD